MVAARSTCEWKLWAEGVGGAARFESASAFGVQRSNEHDLHRIMLLKAIMTTSTRFRQIDRLLRLPGCFGSHLPAQKAGDSGQMSGSAKGRQTPKQLPVFGALSKFGGWPLLFDTDRGPTRGGWEAS